MIGGTKAKHRAHWSKAFALKRHAQRGKFHFTLSATDHGRSGNQLPSEDYVADRDGAAPERMRRPCPPLNHRRIAIKLDKPVAI
jgi:hypothetical protein